MALCVVCRQEKTNGESRKVYTGRFLSSSVHFVPNIASPSGGVATASRTTYTDFLQHEFFVCSGCKRKASILNTVIGGPILLFAACSGMMTLFTKGKTFAFLCVGSVLALFLGAGILALLQRVGFKNDIWEILKKEALVQRGVTDEGMIEVFSEADYNDMLKSS